MLKGLINFLKSIGKNVLVTIISAPILFGLAAIINKFFKWNLFEQRVSIPVWLLVIIVGLCFPAYIIFLTRIFEKKKRRERMNVKGLPYIVEYYIKKSGDYKLNFEPLCPKCNSRLESGPTYTGGFYRRCPNCKASTTNKDFPYYSYDEIKLLLKDEIDRKYNR